MSSSESQKKQAASKQAAVAANKLATRPSSDPCAYSHKVMESTSELRYRLEPTKSFNHNYHNVSLRDPMYVYDQNYDRDGTKRVEVENALLSIARKNSDDPAKRFPVKADVSGIKYKTMDLRTTSTLLTRPRCSYRELSTNHLTFTAPSGKPTYLYCPQFGTNTSLQYRDNYRPCLQKPMDQSRILPKSNVERVSTYER